jgi:hypothetical protein
MSSSLPIPSLRGRAPIPSPACGGGLGRGPSAVRLAVAAMMEETYLPSSFVPAEASGCSTGLMVDILDRDDTRQFG